MSFANPHHAQNPALRQAAKQGLRPYPFELQPGMVLYRYIDVKKSTPEVASDGPWWFEYESFQRIKHFAQRNGYAHPILKTAFWMVAPESRLRRWFNSKVSRTFLERMITDGPCFCLSLK
jgi:hypothetical protein